MGTRRSISLEGDPGMTEQTLNDRPVYDQPGPSPMNAAPTAGAQLLRPARALLGWLPSEQGEFLLAGQVGAPPSEQHRARMREARDEVAAREGGINQAALVSAPPSELADHLARLESTPGGARMLADGWRIGIVDLGMVAAFQPSVFTDTTAERVAGVDPADLRSIAEVSLPIADAAPVAMAYDPVKQAYIITSPHPNLRVIGNVNGPLPDGTPTFGFALGVTPPFMQVAGFQGRYVLRDGYHRAFGLLGRGITHVPAYVREFDTTENLAPPGMLPYGAWLGDRPPLLCDYHDDRVAESVSLPAQHRLIVIQALEVFAQN
jgi:hypothetical protein